MTIIQGGHVIEGGIGPLTQATGTNPVEGTDEVQNVEISGTPTGGTYRLAYGGRSSAAITWHATTNTHLANIRNGLMGIASVQTLSFLGIASGTFRLTFRGQETGLITWHATPATLAGRIDTALEALGNIGTSGVVSAAVISGTPPALVTVSVTFANRGYQPLIGVSDKRLVAGVGYTDATLSLTVADTTPGVDGPIGPAGVTVADVDLASGVGNYSITFDGDDYANRAQPLITVARNDMTSTDPEDAATVEVTETTPGVPAFGLGLLIGGEVVDTNDGAIYVNEGTAQSPDYKQVTTS